MQFTAGASTALNSTDSSTHTERAPNQRAKLTHQVVNLLLVFFCRLTETQAKTTGQLSHGEDIPRLARVIYK
jgi:hypothetical protein